VLFEDFPGTGKTTRPRRLRARSTRSSSAAIPPDLLPSDILGVSVFSQRDSCFISPKAGVHEHPAGRRNQSRLAAHAVGLARGDGRGAGERGGRTADLSELFFVIATQNPVEFRGTYPLPEAQMDRFRHAVHARLRHARGRGGHLTAQQHNHPLDELKPAVTLADVLALQARGRGRADRADELKRYAVDLVAATRTASNVHWAPARAPRLP